jgi:aspartyl protease family protein
MSDDQYTRTGRAMFVVVWIILFVGMFLFFYYQGKPTVYVANHTEYIVSSDKNGHYYIQGRINDFPVEFLVDTGATSVAIPQALADRLHITGRYPITLATANGEVTGSLARVRQLSFGQFILSDVKVVIMPGSEEEEVLLGMNVLSQFNITQQGNRLVLKQK